MYLTPGKNYWAIDIEGDPIPSTRIWCLCAINIITHEQVSLTKYEDIVAWFQARKAEQSKFIGHNIIGYDAPTLNRLLSVGLVMSELIDTMILSMLYSPSIEGGHSLDAWGQRLKYPKLDHSDFSQFTPEMLIYCLRDTELAKRVYLQLVSRMAKLAYTDFGLKIEHESWQIIQQQQKDGFKFDIENAHILYARLKQIIQEIQEKIYAIWPPELKHVATFKRPFKKDGNPSTNYTRHCGEYEKVEIDPEGDRYLCYSYVAFNVGSPDQRTEKLLELGWSPRPNELTPTGKPKPTSKGRLVPSLEEFVQSSGLEGPRLIAQWMEISARANMINTWIEAYNETTGCIHGRLWLANTLRYRHSDPNTANVPGVRIKEVKDDTGKVVKKSPLMGLDGVFTYEARNLWICRNSVERRLVGVDAKGIQLRVLAHYLNNPAFTKEVIDGDPHSYNQEIGQFRTRSVAKTFIYAFLLGAGDERVGEIIGGSPKEGKKVKERFISNFPGLGSLLDNLDQQIRRTGRIRLCDGTPLIVTQPHTRLGYLLQGDESRIMKLANINARRLVRQRKLDVIKVGDIHDEWQNDALAAHAEEFGFDVCPIAFRTAGEAFNYRVPIDCDAKIGLTWAETH